MFLQLVLMISLFSGIWTKVPLYTNDWAVEVSHPGVDPNVVAARHGHSNLGRVGSIDNLYHFRHHSVMKRSTGNAHYHTIRLKADREILWAEQQRLEKRVKRRFKPPTDPLWDEQWYLKNSRMDHNVLPVWKRGVTGKGIVLSVVDDGIQYSHPDLSRNYDPIASHRNTMIDIHSYTSDHGTACAGEISAGRNSHCGVGVAYDARVGGIQVLTQDDVSNLPSLNEAEALSFRPQYIDIYTSSWGPDDDGKTVDGPTWATRKGIQNGVLQGRDGLGSIYVWAAGNGGSMDDCNCDGYASSIYTISVSAATNLGTQSWYSEQCTSTLTTAYSNGGTKGVITTSLNDSCTDDFGGTSAAAPLVAGIIALSLQVNPHLNWRDVQHVVVRASRVIDSSDSLWATNGAGHHVNPKYGFGILDAEKAVELARQWTSVPDQHTCYARSYTSSSRNEANNGLVLTMTTDGCHNDDNEVRYLEHVVSHIDLQSTYRGDISIDLISPQGTRSQLLHCRSTDTEEQEFSNWPFMSTHHWGENPVGEWKLEVKKTNSETKAKLNNWVLIFYGTKFPPDMQSNQYKLYEQKMQKSAFSSGRTVKDPYIRLHSIQPRNRKILTTLNDEMPSEAAVAQSTVHHTAAIVLLIAATTAVTILIVCLVVVLRKRQKVESIVQPNKKKDPYLFESSQLQFEDET